MKKLIILLTFSSFVFAQNSFNVNIEGLASGDSIRIITQKGVEQQFEQWVVGLENSQVSAEFELDSGEWAVFLDAPGYYFPSSQLVNIPSDISATFTLTEASGEDYSYTWQEDDSYVGHATQVYVNEPLEIVVLNDTVPVPSDYSAIKLRNQYGVILSNEEEIWSIDDSYRLYKMFESLPTNPFGEGTNVDFETGENITGVFTLSNNNLDQDLELTTIGGVKHARVGKDAFTYASPQIVTINDIKGKFYSKRLYHVIVNFITDFANDDDMVNWIAQESFGVTFMQPNQELEDLMNEDSSNFQEFFSEEKLEILAMFEELPEGFHKQDGLKYLVRRVNGQVNPQYPNAAAIAWTGLETIEWMSVAFTVEINDTRRLILHEKAHFLWAYSFDQNIKDEWIEIGGWFEDPTAGSGWSTNQTTGFVSPYSHAINPNEDMAESIAYYLTNPDALLTVSVQKFEFIRDRIMHGTRYVAMIPDELTFTVYNLFPDYTFPGKVTKMEVSVSGASNEDKEVTIKATMNSTNPNVDGATAGYMRLVSSTGTIHDTWMQTENGQELDSVLVGTTTFSKLEKSGYWDMSYFRISDQVGNQRYENTSTIGWKLFIDNPLEDVTPPSWNYDLEMEIVEDYFTPNYDTEPTDEENGILMKAIKFAYTVYDNSPMQKAITRIFHPTLDDPDAEVYEKQIQGGPINIDSPEYYNDYNSNKTFEQYLAIPEWFPSGYYAVSSINMHDLGGNYSTTYFVNDTTDFYISPLQRNKIFKDVRDSIYVQTQFPDHIQPQLDLDNITIVAEPTNPEAPNGETRVDITMMAKDLSDYEGYESGVASVGFVLRDPLGGEHGFQTGNSTMNHPELDLYDFNPDLNSNWSAYHFDFVLPVGSPPGEWGMTSAQIRDKAGNTKNYSFIEYVRFDIIESDIELETPLEAEILSDYVNAQNVENISASISCSPCEGLNYVYTIYSLTGGNVVQGTGVFSNDSITLEGIDTSGVLDGHINLTVQVTDLEDQLIATKTTQYFKDTFFPNSYYTSSNIQNQGTSNIDDFIISVIVEEQDIGGTYEMNVNSTQVGTNQGLSLSNLDNSYSGDIESDNFDVMEIDFSSIDDGYIEIELIITDAVGNEGEPISSYYYLENGNISYLDPEENSFEIESQSTAVNSEFNVEVGLNNNSEVTAFQFDLTHNESAYELLSDSSTLTSRAENHTLSVSTIDDNTIRVLVYSAANEVISVGDGAILNLSFNSKNEPGAYNLNLSDIVLSDANGASLGVSSSNGSVTILGPRYNLVTSSVDFGEIPMESSPTQSVSVSNTGNQDLIISGHILDTPFSINQSYPATISPGNSSSFTINADTSSKQVISKELSFTTNDQDALRALQTTTIQADIFAVNEIYIGSGQGESNTQITIPVSISNMEPFSGFQFDVTLPNDVSYVENSAAFTTRASDHNIAANMIDSNTLRFVSYSGSNANFLGNEGEVFSFKVIPNITSGTYTLPISNSIISNVELGDILSEAYNGSFTINAPYLSTSVQTINYGSVPITETRTTNITLTNTGSAELTIDELVFDASVLSFPLTIPTTLAVGESTPVELIFDPMQIGSFNQDISIRNNSPEEQQIIMVLAEVFSPNFLRLIDKDVYRNNSYDIDINLVNNDNIRAIQFDLDIPEGFTFDYNDVIETSILNNFTTSISLLSNGNYRFVIYTVSNDYVIPGDETILQLPVFVENSLALGQYTFDFSNIVLSSESNQNISSEALSIGYINVIEDTTVPVITLLGDETVTIEVGTAYPDAGATALDNYDGDLTSSIVVTGSVDINTVGTYTVSYDVTDANGNVATTVIRTVNVVDTTVPVITLLGDETVTIEVGTAYTDAGATALDNYDGDLTSSIVVTGSVDINTVGTYTVSYDVTDANGNVATTVIRTVNVVESLSIDDNDEIKLSIFPNPTSTSWHIKSSKIIESLDLFDLTGKRLIHRKTFSNDIRLDATNLPNGIYLILINNNKTVRLIKN